jgi:hypothetical protein
VTSGVGVGAVLHGNAAADYESGTPSSLSFVHP